MMDNYDLSTSIMHADQSQENVKEYFLEEINERVRNTHYIFPPANPTNEVIIASVICCVGLVLNALILRCYWSVKTSTAVYIRVLAVYDCISLLELVGSRMLKLYHISPDSVLEKVRSLIVYQLVCNSVLGPLFIALDRIIIVCNPHSFKKYEKKLRVAKCLIALVNIVLILALFVTKFTSTNETSKLVVIMTRVLFSSIFALQWLTCVALYAVIVLKIRASTRKVQPITQINPQ